MGLDVEQQDEQDDDGDGHAEEPEKNRGHCGFPCVGLCNERANRKCLF